MLLEKTLREIYSINPYEREYRNKTIFKSEYTELYGEVTYQSTEAIVNQFKEHFNNDTVFYDMGSGLGKMVVHVGLKYNAKKSCGVELSAERMVAANEIKDKYCGDNIVFIEEDFFKVDISDATVVYVDNTAMQDPITIKLFEMLPKGCLFICRRNCTKLNLTEIENESLKTTYGKKNIFHIIK